MKAMCEIEIPEGWDFVGHRRTISGDNYLGEDGFILTATTVFPVTPQIIVRQEKKIRRVLELESEKQRSINSGEIYSEALNSHLHKCFGSTGYGFVWKEIKDDGK